MHTETAAPSLHAVDTLVVLLRDLSELTKARVTVLIVLTAWCGYYLSARAADIAPLGWRWLAAMFGIAAVSSGTAALNEVMEYRIDAMMRRTARRPIPSGRISVRGGIVIGALLTIGGSIFLAATVNSLTAWLTLATSIFYLAAYTPLKPRSAWCTFVGAFPGAMPAVLGWAAASGQLTVRTAILFAILFIWQFPHFFSIAWLYRDDYAAGGIRMLPVVEPDGRSTALRVVAYGIVLLPVSVLPSFVNMTSWTYAVAAVVLGAAYLYFCVRLAQLQEPVSAPASRIRARQLLQASVLYLPALLGFMAATAISR